MAQYGATFNRVLAIAQYMVVNDVQKTERCLARDARMKKAAKAVFQDRK